MCSTKQQRTKTANDLLDLQLNRREKRLLRRTPSLVIASFLAVASPASCLFTAALTARSAATVLPKTEIVTHELTSAQVQEDFQRLRFSLEHADAGLYRYTSKATMDARFDAIARQLSHPMSDFEFYRMLCPLIAEIRNSHTSIRPPADALKSIRGIRKCFPVRSSLSRWQSLHRSESQR